MGDGFRAQLAILSAISTIDKGVVIIEEPEIRLHPGYMASISNQIIKSSLERNIQYFISTHSTEFLEFILMDNPDIVNVTKLYLNENTGRFDYESMNGHEAYEKMDKLKIDLRGV